MSRGFNNISAGAIATGVILTVITSVLCYLTALAAESQKCVGSGLILGYRSSFVDFLGFPLFSFGSLIPLFMSRRSPQIEAIFKQYDVPTFSIGRRKISFGELVVTLSLMGFVVFIALITISSILRYQAISRHCLYS